MVLNTTPTNDLPIVCDPTALSAEQSERWVEVGKQMYAAVQEIRELPNGYAFRLPSDAAMFMIVAEDLTMERLCCPFLHFTVDIEPNRGPLWLSFTGGEGVKAFLRISFEASNLLDEEVSKAAGFSVASRKAVDSVDSAVALTTEINDRFVQRGKTPFTD